MAKSKTLLTGPIAEAVKPLKELAIAQAVNAAKAKVARFAAELAAADGNINAVAPYPDRKASMSEFQKEIARRHYQWAHSVCMSDVTKPASYMPNSPSYMVISQERCDHYYGLIEKQAAAHYDAYVGKLIGKIGKVKTAELIYRGDVWYHSDLMVTKADGSSEIWYTQIILNYSKYGVPFNQWPTRLVK